jgi:hypothetical protein
MHTTLTENAHTKKMHTTGVFQPTQLRFGIISNKPACGGERTNHDDMPIWHMCFYALGSEGVTCGC